MKAIGKGIILLLQASQFILWHTPISIMALIGAYFTAVLFINPTSETMSLTNYTFAIVTALASVSFGYARCLNEVETRSRIQYCGERFLHSGLLFLVASIVKYFLLQDPVQDASGNPGAIGTIIAIIGLFPGFFFLGSLVNSIAALRELNALLYARKKPGQELIKFF